MDLVRRTRRGTKSMWRSLQAAGSRLRTPDVVEFDMSPQTDSLTVAARKRSVPIPSRDHREGVAGDKLAQPNFPGPPNFRGDLRSSESGRHRLKPARP